LQRFVAFQRFLRLQTEDEYAARYGTRDGAASYASAVLAAPDAVDKAYSRALLHVTAILGTEYCTSPADPASSAASHGAPATLVKRPDLLPRPMRDVLLVDTDAGACGRFPANALCLPPVSAAIRQALAAEAAEATESAAAVVGPQSLQPRTLSPSPRSASAIPDLDLVAGLVGLYKAAAEARARASGEEDGSRSPSLSVDSARGVSLAVAEAQGNAGGQARPGPDWAAPAVAGVAGHAGCIRDWLAYFREGGGGASVLVVGAAAPPSVANLDDAAMLAAVAAIMDWVHARATGAADTAAPTLTGGGD